MKRNALINISKNMDAPWCEREEIIHGGATPLLAHDPLCRDIAKFKIS